MADILTTLGELGGELVLGVSVILVLGLAATFIWRSPVLQQRLGEATLAATMLFLLLACIPLPRPLAPLTDASGTLEAIDDSPPASAPLPSPQPTVEPDGSNVSTTAGSAQREPEVAIPLDLVERTPTESSVGDAFPDFAHDRGENPKNEELPRTAVVEADSRFGAGRDDNVFSTSGNEKSRASQSTVIPAAVVSAQQTTVSPWGQRTAAVYLAVGLAILGWLGLGWLRLQRILRCTRAPAVWLSREYEVLPWLMNRPRPRLLVSPHAARPFCYGLWRPCIVIPVSDAQSPRQQRLRQILLHEMAHAARRDAIGLGVATIAMPVLYFHPAYWLLRRRLEFAVELLADDWASQHSSPANYAGELVAWAQERGFVPRAAWSGIGMFRSPSAFYRRMSLLVARPSPLAHRTSSRSKVAMFAAGAVIVASTAATFGVGADAATLVDESAQAQSNSVGPTASGDSDTTAGVDPAPPAADDRLATLEVGKSPGLLRVRGSGGMRHPGEVDSLRCSPDGKLLASVGWNEVRVWEIASCRLLQRLQYSEFNQTQVAFSGDSKMLITGHFSGDVRVWSVADGTLQHLLTRHTSAVRKVVTTRDGATAATIDDQGLVCLWNLATGKLRRTFSTIQTTPDALRFTADDKHVEVLFQATDWLCWNAETGERLPSKQAIDRSRTFVTADTKYVATMEGADYILREVEGGKVRLRSKTDGRELPEIGLWRVRVLQTASIPGTDRVAVVRHDKLEVYDLSGDEAILVSTHPTDRLGPCFTPDGRYTFDLGDGDRIYGWDLKEDREVGRGDGFDARIGTIAYSPDGKYLATAGSNDGSTLRLFNADDLSEIEEVTANLRPFSDERRGRRASITRLDFSPDGKKLAAVGDSGLLIWSVPDMRLDRRLDGGGISSVQFMPNGKQLALGRWSAPGIGLFDLASGQTERTLDEHWESVTSIDASLHSDVAATGSRDRSVVLWTLPDWTMRHRLEGPRDWVLSVSVSDDGARVVASAVTSVHVWDVQTGKLLWRREMMRYYVRAAVLSPDGKFVAISGGYDGIVGRRTPGLMLVDVATGKDAKVIDGFDGEPCGIGFSPDSRRLVVATDGGSLAQWNVEELLRDKAKEDR